MKFPAILAVFLPWIVAVFAYFVVKSGAAAGETLQIFPWLWMFISPLYIAGVILISYREGQWSKNDE